MLGTPPAFILSQDRTLTFKCISSPKRLDRSSDQNLSLAFVLSVFTLLGLFCSLNIHLLIRAVLRNASHFPSFCYRKIQISKNISWQASLHDLFFSLCALLNTFWNFSGLHYYFIVKVLINTGLAGFSFIAVRRSDI